MCFSNVKSESMTAPISFSSDDSTRLQEGLTKLEEWSDTWLLRFHPDKCKHMQIGKKNDDNNYSLHRKITMGQAPSLAVFQMLHCAMQISHHLLPLAALCLIGNCRSRLLAVHLCHMVLTCYGVAFVIQEVSSRKL
jgi:hypothetical protein